MSDSWQRQRDPDGVPTPTAVAVSDFCRRAKAPASPREVRLALALVSDEDDFRVRALTEGEPKAWPLGPFAVVDMLHGTSPELAARRQEVGYYQLAEELAAARAQPEAAAAPPAPTSDPQEVVPPPIFAAPAREGGKKKGKERELTMSERIAPRKRAASPSPSELPNVEESLAALGRFSGGRKEAPAPRGRFTNLDTTRSSADELLAAPGAELLRGLVEQHRHRFAIQRSLARSYSMRGGGELSLGLVENALAQHGLLEALERQERELLLGSYTDNRGAAGRVAHALGLTLGELAKLVGTLGVEREVEEIRERFRREALSPRSLTLRLDLLGRSKYLEDLGIERRFSKSLEGDLRKLFKEVAEEATSYGDLLERASKRSGAPAELLSRAADKLGIAHDVRRELSSESNTPPA